MTTKAIKLFAVDRAPGYMQATMSDEDFQVRVERRSGRQVPELETWHPFRASWWHRSKRRAKLPAITTYFLGSSRLCVRQDALPLLGPLFPAQAEPLPFTIEGDAWCMLRPRHGLTGIDPATSSALTSPSVESPADFLLHGYEWINAIDPGAEEALIFGTPPNDGETWVTEEFVRRVRAAGLKGVQFVHSGYLVRDLAQAVPNPAPGKRFPWTRPAQPSAPPPPALVSELDVEGLALRDQARVHAACMLPAASTAPAAECIDMLDRWLEQVHRRWKRLDPTARAELVAAAAATFGDLVCRELGWEWGTVRRGDEGPWLAIATADKTCAIALERVAERQFSKSERTLKLLFNMLKAGQLPAPRADGAALLG